MNIDQWLHYKEHRAPSSNFNRYCDGGLYDADTKLIRFGARDYDPTVGRWTTKDPSGFNGGTTNLYEYAYSNPMSYYDSDGLAPTNGSIKDWPGGGGGGGSGGGAAFNGGGSEIRRPGRNDPNQQAVIDLAKDAKRTGGTTYENANTLVNWAKEYNIPANPRIDLPHNGNTNYPHFHIHPVNHIPICD